MSHVDGFDDGVGYGVYGEGDTGDGVVGKSYSRRGVFGIGFGDVGVLGWGGRRGVGGWSLHGPGIHGSSNNGVGVYGLGNNVGVWGVSNNGVGASGQSERGNGLSGFSSSAAGVFGISGSGPGLYGTSEVGVGLYAISRSDIAAWIDGNARVGGHLSIGASARVGWDLRVNQNLTVGGTLQKGGGSFKIDHPLDPANKYLSHSFVESPDMKNVYDGMAALDHNGEANIELPDWFGVLNKDFRYQLTAIGAPGPNLHIAEEILDTEGTNAVTLKNTNNKSKFKIAGGTWGMKVSWQVTGIRKDPWANANRIQVEEDKPAKERGYYIHPDLYPRPEEKGELVCSPAPH